MTESVQTTDNVTNNVNSDSYEINWKNSTLTIDTKDAKELTNLLIKGKHLDKPLAIKIPVKNVLNSDDAQNEDKDGIINRSIVFESADTNSGVIKNSQFIDGGLGDIGQQWRHVRIYKSNVINHHTSINLTLSGNNGSVMLDKKLFELNKTVVPGDKRDY